MCREIFNEIIDESEEMNERMDNSMCLSYCTEKEQLCGKISKERVLLLSNAKF